MGHWEGGSCIEIRLNLGMTSQMDFIIILGGVEGSLEGRT